MELDDIIESLELDTDGIDHWFRENNHKFPPYDPLDVAVLLNVRGAYDLDGSEFEKLEAVEDVLDDMFSRLDGMKETIHRTREEIGSRHS